MPQTARGRKTSSTRGRQAGAASRSRSGGGAARGLKKRPKKKAAASRGKAAKKATRRTTSRPRRKTTTGKKAATSRRSSTATRKKAATRRKPTARKKATLKKKTARRPSPARKKAASRKKAPRRKPVVRATTSGSNGRPRSGGERVKDALLARRAETLDLLERSSDYGKQRLREDAEDLVDQATDSQARDVVYALSSAEGAMIKQIDGALERIDAGDYGKCDNCGEPIQKRRLQAVPWTRLCVACQELKEQGILQPD